MNAHHPKYVAFNAEMLRGNPGMLAALSRLYCDVFSMDENFGEYRQCPRCGKYFSFELVTQHGVNSCSNGHCQTVIVPAWEPDKVAKEILEQSAEPGFYGIAAYLGRELVGFGWIRVLPMSHVEKEWGQAIADTLLPLCPQGETVYFDEVGVARSARGLGIGKTIVKLLCGHARIVHAKYLTILRTHKNSRAHTVFAAAGYRDFAEDTEYGNGRVMMKCNHCCDLLPEAQFA